MNTDQTQQEKAPTLLEMVRSLAAGVKNGDITAEQAQKMRQQLGVSRSMFTRKKFSRTRRKARNKMARASRKINRRNGCRGQKLSGRY